MDKIVGGDSPKQVDRSVPFYFGFFRKPKINGVVKLRISAISGKPGFSRKCCFWIDLFQLVFGLFDPFSDLILDLRFGTSIWTSIWSSPDPDPKSDLDLDLARSGPQIRTPNWTPKMGRPQIRTPDRPPNRGPRSGREGVLVPFWALLSPFARRRFRCEQFRVFPKTQNPRGRQTAQIRDFRKYRVFPKTGILAIIGITRISTFLDPDLVQNRRFRKVRFTTPKRRIHRNLQLTHTFWECGVFGLLLVQSA